MNKKAVQIELGKQAQTLRSWLFVWEIFLKMGLSMGKLEIAVAPSCPSLYGIYVDVQIFKMGQVLG